MSAIAPTVAVPESRFRFERFLSALPAQQESLPVERDRPEAIIAALQRREPDTWRELFVREMPSIYQYVASRVPTGTEAEDLTSEIFEAAWASADRLQDRGLPPRAWLFGIARNVVNDHRRRWFRRPPAFALNDNLLAEGTSSADDLVLADAIARLPAAHAEVINLRFVQGLSLQETAEALGSTVDAVKGRQARALLSLREALA